MYQSPLHILSDLDEDISKISEPGFLLRLRKKLLAEFNLSNSTVIEINGKSYSKDEVIKTIDVLMGNPQMPMHSFIFANKKLLDFLENDNSKIRIHELRDLQVPEEMKGMLNTAILERLIYNLKKAFQSRNFDLATELVAYAPELSEEDKLNWHEEINKNIVNLREHIQSVRHGDSGNMPRELDYLKKNSLAVFLNKLPADFIDVVNSFVNEVINAMVAYQKNKGHDRAYLYYVSTNLLKVKCDEELMQLIKGNHVVFTANYEGRGGSTSGGGGGEGMSAGRIIYIVIALVVIIARIATCSHRSSKSYDYNSFNNMNNIYKTLQQQKTPPEEYKAYRKQVAGYKNYKGLYSRAPLVDLYDEMSGENPFRYIIHDTRYDYEDTSLSRVIIKNTSGLKLIVTAFNEYDARSYFFFDGKPDTLSFYPGDKISLYFGDSLAANEAPSESAKTSILKAIYEVYFIQCPDEAYEILDRDYEIEMLAPQKPISKKKKKKKTPLPVVELSKDFLKNDSFENGKVKLSRYNIYSSESVEEPVIVESVEAVE